MTTERILTLKIRMWRKRYFSTTKAVISIMIVLGYLLGLNAGGLIVSPRNDTNLSIFDSFMSTDYAKSFGQVIRLMTLIVLL